MELNGLLSQPPMRHKDIRLLQPLPAVRRAADKNDTITVPTGVVSRIAAFFADENIKYQAIDNPSLYPADKKREWIRRIVTLDEEYFDADDEYMLLITPFDSE